MMPPTLRDVVEAAAELPLGSAASSAPHRPVTPRRTIVPRGIRRGDDRQCDDRRQHRKPVLRRLTWATIAGPLGAAVFRLAVQLDWGQAGRELDKPRYAAISQIIGGVLGGLIGLLGVWWADRRAAAD